MVIVNPKMLSRMTLNKVKFSIMRHRHDDTQHKTLSIMALSIQAPHKMTQSTTFLLTIILNTMSKNIIS
jgi:hypothetical protein